MQLTLPLDKYVNHIVRCLKANERNLDGAAHELFLVFERDFKDVLERELEVYQNTLTHVNFPAVSVWKKFRKLKNERVSIHALEEALIPLFFLYVAVSEQPTFFELNKQTHRINKSLKFMK